jgi:hypothetical protein
MVEISEKSVDMATDQKEEKNRFQRNIIDL